MINHEERWIAHRWSINDVLEVRGDLSQDEAWQVLQEVEKAIDSNVGINWETIEGTAQGLYPVQEIDIERVENQGIDWEPKKQATVFRGLDDLTIYEARLSYTHDLFEKHLSKADQEKVYFIPNEAFKKRVEWSIEHMKRGQIDSINTVAALKYSSKAEYVEAVEKVIKASSQEELAAIALDASKEMFSGGTRAVIVDGSAFFVSHEKEIMKHDMPRALHESKAPIMAYR